MLLKGKKGVTEARSKKQIYPEFGFSVNRSNFTSEYREFLHNKVSSRTRADARGVASVDTVPLDEKEVILCLVI